MKGGAVAVFLYGIIFHACVAVYASFVLGPLCALFFLSGPLLEVLGVAYRKSWVLLFGAAMHLIYALASVGLYGVVYLDTLEHCRDEGLRCGVEGQGISVFGIREGWVFVAFVFVQVTLVITLVRLSMIAKTTRVKDQHHDASVLVINEDLAGFA